MAVDNIRSLVRVSSESGPLFDHLLTMQSNKRSERIRTLAYMGLIVERGLLNVGAVLPVGASIANIAQQASIQSNTPSPHAEQTTVPAAEKKGVTALFDKEDLEHMGM